MILDIVRARIWCDKGYALGIKSKYEDSLKAFDKAIGYDQNYANAWNNKGKILLKLCRYDDAIDAFSKAIDIDQYYIDAWFNKGDALSQNGRFDEAINLFEKARVIKPSDSSRVRYGALTLGILASLLSSVIFYMFIAFIGNIIENANTDTPLDFLKGVYILTLLFGALFIGAAVGHATKKSKETVSKEIISSDNIITYISISCRLFGVAIFLVLNYFTFLVLIFFRKIICFLIFLNLFPLSWALLLAGICEQFRFLIIIIEILRISSN